MTKTFRDLGVDGALCDALATTGITHPFPIQELTLPLALTGNDLIGQARTGTGKTLAFGLPLLQRLDPDKKATQALVVVPTRELCLQVFDDLKIGATKGLTSIAVYGGVGFDEQIEALTTGVHVVVGTPGRLLDHLNRGNLDLSNVTQLVLDEADEMLDMGFLPDVERLVEACQGENRHTMLFSATMPTAIVKLARRYMDHPTFTRADTEAHETAPNVTQHFLQVHRMDKPRVLARILQSPNRGGVYVFVRTKHMADRLVNELEELGVPSVPVHGDLRQSSREKNLDRFRSGKATVLVATEVAARGLDVHGVTHVVNYDCPDDEKMYLHRIGRTARAGEAGVAVTFAEFNEVDKLNVIRKRVGAENAQVEQVFSTSDVLAELFDLPDTKPWAHLSKKTSKGGSREGSRDAARGRSSSSRDGGDRPSGKGDRSRDGGPSDAGSGSRSGNGRSRSERRPGQTDGRSKNQRQTEGAGGGHDASRSRGQADAGATDTTSEAAGADATSDAPTANPPSERARSRTRTRSRTSSAKTGGEARGGRSEGREEDGPEDSSSRTDRDRRTDDGDSTSGSGQQRRRARGGRSGRGASRGAGSSAGSDRERGSDAGDQDGGAAGGRDRGPKGGSRERQRASSGRSSGRADSGRRTRDGSSSDGGDAANGAGSRNGAEGGRSRGRSEETAGRSRKSGGGRGGRSRSSSDRADSEPIELQRRGRSARGEGQPQPARRVKVEHLP